MSFSQREADWLGDVDIEQGVLEVLTEGFPEEHVPKGMARYEMPLNYGQPTVNDWLDKQCQEGMKVSDEKRLAIVVGGIASIAGGGGEGGNGDGGGKLAEKPIQEHKAAQQEQPQKKEPQPQKEDQAQGGQQEQQEGGEQEPEPQKPSFASFGAGTYQVGANIQPGTYRTRVGSPNCYWEA